MTFRQRVLAALREGGFGVAPRIAHDPEGRAALLEIARDAGTAERVAAAEASLATAPRWPWASALEADEATLAIASAVYGLACEAKVSSVVLQALGDPCHVIRYMAVVPLRHRLRAQDALVYLRAEARYGRYKATEIGLEALTAVEDLHALLGSVAPDDLPFAVLFLGFKGWSAPLRHEANRLLREFLNHPDGRVRATAALTCPDAEDPAVRTALLDAADLPEPWIRGMIVERLSPA